MRLAVRPFDLTVPVKRLPPEIVVDQVISSVCLPFSAKDFPAICL